ncbi:MAG: 3-isopropylmalate dehydratase small subunit [Candidatus Bathyarchaeia archaeon]
MMLNGKAWKFEDDVNTDLIIPYKYKARTLDPKELGMHCMEGIDPNFSKKVSKGDFIIAGKNFGCGSSREQAPIAIKACGISAIIAKSFARIFYRNAINIGLPVLECKEGLEAIEEGDLLEVNLKEGIVRDLSKNLILKASKIPDFLEKLLDGGGLVEYYKKYGKFPWE